MVDKPRAWEILLLLLLIGRWRRIVGQSQRQYVSTTNPYMILMKGKKFIKLILSSFAFF